VTKKERTEKLKKTKAKHEAAVYFYSHVWRLNSFEPSMMQLIDKALRANKYAADFNCATKDKQSIESHAIEKIFKTKDSLIEAFEVWRQMCTDHRTIVTLHRDKFTAKIKAAYDNNKTQWPALAHIPIDKEIDGFILALTVAEQDIRDELELIKAHVADDTIKPKAFYKWYNEVGKWARKYKIAMAETMKS